MKKIFLVSVFLISVILFSPPLSIGGEPPPTIGGPGVAGMLILENERDDAGDPTGWMTVTFRGMCKTECEEEIMLFPPSARVSFRRCNQRESALLRFAI